MYVIGMNPFQGLYTEAERQQGKGATPGTRASIVGPNGESKEFVAVKLGAATWINGVAVIIDGVGTGGVGSAVATASGLPAATMHQRLGILVFSSATATQTMAGTAFGWAQIYGQALAWVSASVTLPGQQLAVCVVIATMPLVWFEAETCATGIVAITTQTASTTANLQNVFLMYPHFAGLPDANLA